MKDLYLNWLFTLDESIFFVHVCMRFLHWSEVLKIRIHTTYSIYMLDEQKIFEFLHICWRSEKFSNLKCLGLKNTILCVILEDNSCIYCLNLFLQWAKVFSLSIRKPPWKILLWRILAIKCIKGFIGTQKW